MLPYWEKPFREKQSPRFEWNNVIPRSDKAWIWGLALNGSINYRICSGLYAGIGIEPTGYFKTDKLKENLKGQIFDFPVVLTLGYELRTA